MDVINISVDGNFEGSEKSVGPEAINRKSRESKIVSQMCHSLRNFQLHPPLTTGYSAHPYPKHPFLTFK